MPRYTLKNIRSNWSEESLFRKIESVQHGNSLRKATKQFKVPQTTLKSPFADDKDKNTRIVFAEHFNNSNP